MINAEILRSFGFEQSQTDLEKFTLNGLNVHLENGEVNWINEDDNYYGITVNITTPRQIANLISLR